MRSSHDPIPVTIVTGYLGAGKTTLLNRILTGGHGGRLAVIVNEYGEVPIDHDLVLNIEEGIYTLASGCICCTVRDDLVEVLDDLLARREAFDHILVETTGLAEPGGIIMTFLTHPDAGEAFVVDGIVAVADAVHLPAQLGRSPEVAHQLAYADVILLNKCDLVNGTAAAVLEEMIRGMNPLADIYRTSQSDADTAVLLDIGGFDPGRIRIVRNGAAETEHRHEAHIDAISVTTEGDLEPERFEQWIAELIAARHEDLYRMKGIIGMAGQPRRYIFHGVHGLSSWQYGERWGDEPRVSRFVVIGRGLNREEVVRGFRRCAAPGVPG